MEFAKILILINYSGYIQAHCQNNKTIKTIKRADQILPEVYGTTLSTHDAFF